MTEHEEVQVIEADEQAAAPEVNVKALEEEGDIAAD